MWFKGFELSVFLRIRLRVVIWSLRMGPSKGTPFVPLYTLNRKALLRQNPKEGKGPYGGPTRLPF